MTAPISRRGLRRMLADAKVQSCADGSIKITPTWRDAWKPTGLGGRMKAARLVSEVLNVKGEK